MREKKFKKQPKKVNSYKYTLEEIQEFVCGSDQSGKAFVTSPYQGSQIDKVTKGYKYIQINEQHYNMSCEVFLIINNHGFQNILQHFFFNTSGELKPSFIKNFHNESTGMLEDLH